MSIVEYRTSSPKRSESSTTRFAAVLQAATSAFRSKRFHCWSAHVVQNQIEHVRLEHAFFIQLGRRDANALLVNSRGLDGD